MQSRHKLIDDGAGEVWRNLVTVEFARKMDWLLGGEGGWELGPDKEDERM